MKREIGVALVQSPDPLAFWVDDHDADCISTTSRRIILRYYIESFTKLLTTNLENNSFLSGMVPWRTIFVINRLTLNIVLLPMSMFEPVLLDAMVSWASGHLSLRDRLYCDVATRNKGRALQSLAESLSSNEVSLDTQLATCLVLCSMESIMTGHDGIWYTHLAGAAEIIRRLLQDSNGNVTAVLRQFKDKDAGRWLLCNFAYHDILMAVSLDTSTLLPSDEFLALAKGTVADSYFGLAADILSMIADIARLNVELKAQSEHDITFETGTQTFSVGQSLLLASALEERLTQWVCSPSDDDGLVLLAESYRNSALIYLFQCIQRHIPQHAINIPGKINDQVNKTIANIRQMPERCLPECTLLFPLFIAGTEATQQEQIMCIKEKMQSVILSRSFKNVEGALSLLETVWRLRLERQETAFAGYIYWQEVACAQSLMLALT